MQNRVYFPLNGVQRLLEVGLIVFSGFGLFLLLALLSFDPADPSWSQTGYQTSIHNYAGPIGAWLADLLLFSFGWIAYLIPFLVALSGYLLFKRFHDLMSLDYLILGLRIIGLVLTLLTATAISSMNFNDIFYFSSGGVIGDVVSGALLPYFNFIGTILLLLCGFATGLTLMTGISWLTVADALGAACYSAAQFVMSVPQRLKERSKDDYDPFAQSPDEDSPVNRTYVTEEPVLAAPKPRQTPKLGKPVAESLPISPLDEKTQAKAYYSVDTLADENLSFSAIDEPDSGDWEETLHQLDLPSESEVETVLSAVTDDEDDSEEVSHQMEELPSLALLDRPDKAVNPIDPADLERVSRLVEAKLLDFNVEAKVVGVHPGPVVTRFELDLAPGVKVSKITGLSKDLARSLSAISVRVVEVIPGKSYIGLELPNQHREIVRLSEVIGDEIFDNSKSPLTMVLGKDIAGKSVVADLAKMPHLLVAGTTGSGKSVGVNVMICSLLYKSTPDDVRFLMIDPKMLELSIYEGIPHLLTEVVTDMKDAANGLRW
ncbi:DNA translocase FtsK 4TM domain-containing protein, partial [Rheinheimera sp.]|uniref:DNA translocase FtsK 4TM domain-containing protein n=1 Tax=Rheinheimera sp. TaxID=1869214 RepID=UPI0037C5A0AD